MKHLENYSNEKQYAYLITNEGELKKTTDRDAQFYLTDNQYNTIKDLADNINKKILLLEEQKQTTIKYLKKVIFDIKNK